MPAKFCVSKYLYSTDDRRFVYHALQLQSTQLTLEQANALLQLQAKKQRFSSDEARVFGFETNWPQLIQQKIIVPAEMNEIEEFQTQNDLQIQNAVPSLIEIVVTYRDNVCCIADTKCVACNSSDEHAACQTMTIETAQVISDRLRKLIQYRRAYQQLRCLNEPILRIRFNGGETSLAIEPIRIMAESIRSFADETEVRLEVSTNGVNITDEVIQLCKKWRLRPVIQIFGRLATHLSTVIKETGHSSYAHAVLSFRKFREAKILPMIDIDSTDVKIDELIQSLKLYTESLGIKDLAILPEKFATPRSPDSAINYADSYLAILTALKKRGILERVSSRIENRFRKKTQTWYECPSCLEQLSILPDGQIGLCQKAARQNEFILGNIYETSTLWTLPKLNAWTSTSPLYDEQCQACPAIGMCGGGCIRLSSETYGRPEVKHPNTCQFKRETLKWLITNERLNLQAEHTTSRVTEVEALQS
jgi:uncharacterized protein